MAVKTPDLCRQCVFSNSLCRESCVGCPRFDPSGPICKCVTIKEGEECPHFIQRTEQGASKKHMRHETILEIYKMLGTRVQIKLEALNEAILDEMNHPGLPGLVNAYKVALRTAADFEAWMCEEHPELVRAAGHDAEGVPDPEN